jgi:hypothetical protein
VLAERASGRREDLLVGFDFLLGWVSHTYEITTVILRMQEFFWGSHATQPAMVPRVLAVHYGIIETWMPFNQAAAGTERVSSQF